MQIIVNKLFVIMVLLGLAATIKAQVTTNVLPIEQVPDQIQEQIKIDFAGYQPVAYYRGVEDIVDQTIKGKDVDDSSRGARNIYQVVLNSKNGKKTANYYGDGTLVSQFGTLVNLPLPVTIRNAIDQHFPGSKVISDKVKMMSHKDQYQYIYYKLKLKQGQKTILAVFDANGNLIKGKQDSEIYAFKK